MLMKIKKLIKELNKVVERQGDINVFVPVKTDDGGYPEHYSAKVVGVEVYEHNRDENRVSIKYEDKYDEEL